MKIQYASDIHLELSDNSRAEFNLQMQQNSD